MLSVIIHEVVVTVYFWYSAKQPLLTLSVGVIVNLKTLITKLAINGTGGSGVFTA